MKMKTSRAVILTIIAVILAAYILFPFLLVVLPYSISLEKMRQQALTLR